MGAVQFQFKPIVDWEITYGFGVPFIEDLTSLVGGSSGTGVVALKSILKYHLFKINIILKQNIVN